MTVPRTLGRALQATADPPWVIAENGYDPLRESTHASRFAISNGFMGIRGGGAINRGGVLGGAAAHLRRRAVRHARGRRIEPGACPCGGLAAAPHPAAE